MRPLEKNLQLALSSYGEILSFSTGFLYNCQYQHGLGAEEKLPLNH